jgi:predicted RNA-binding protein with PIN domain
MQQEDAIAFLIIDGYNLIGISHDNLKKEREELIESLILYRKRKGHEITLVFDGWKTGEGSEAKNVIGRIRVIYSRIGEKADSVIKRIISSEKHQWIVVTSDRDIIHHAWSSGAIPITSEQFLPLLEKTTSEQFLPLLEKTHIHPFEEYEDEEEEYMQPRQKGNPRKLSKKQKSVLRALKKLS